MSGAAAGLGISLDRVLVAMADFSDVSEKALHHAVAIARRYGAKFYLVHIVSSSGFYLAGHECVVQATDLALREGRDLAARLVENGVLAGLSHEVVVANGNIWEELRHIATAKRVDLIVTGTQGRTGLRKIVMGSTAEDISRHASCPVLTVGPCAPSDPWAHAALHHILYPTDLSSESAQALPYAISLATGHKAKLMLLHVVDQITGEARHDEQRVIAALEDRMRELLPSSPRLNELGLEVEVTEGPVGETILDVATQKSSDLIIMGLKSAAAFVDHLVWSHAYKIVCEACCPVLTIRSPAK
jgi:nucleotide-binding universal stress UspA family protein